MNDNMEFRRARREEAEEILQLYRSLIGTEYCVWTENYPVSYTHLETFYGSRQDHSRTQPVSEPLVR